MGDVSIVNNNHQINELTQKIDLLLEKVSNLESKKSSPKPKKFNWSALKELQDSFKEDDFSAEEMIKK